MINCLVVKGGTLDEIASKILSKLARLIVANSVKAAVFESDGYAIAIMSEGKNAQIANRCGAQFVADVISKGVHVHTHFFIDNLFLGDRDAQADELESDLVGIQFMTHASKLPAFDPKTAN